MTFTQHVTFTVTTEGVIDRGEGQLPSAIRLPALSVTVAPTATAQATTRLLRRLAEEIETKLRKGELMKTADQPTPKTLEDSERWLAIRREASLKIDDTADVMWTQILDPYNLFG